MRSGALLSLLPRTACCQVKLYAKITKFLCRGALGSLQVRPYVKYAGQAGRLEDIPRVVAEAFQVGGG